MMSHAAGLSSNIENISKRTQFPWMAIISVEDSGIWYHNGSGSLISHRHIIASASSTSYMKTDECGRLTAVPAERIRIFLGTTKFNDLSQSGSLQVGVTSVINHPDSKVLYANTIINQIAMIILDHEVAFTEFIRPVCLWSFADESNDTIKNEAFAVGYKHDNKSCCSMIRKHFHVKMICEDTCQNRYHEELVFRNETKLFCMQGSENEDEKPCNRNNQLFIKINANWYLKGISTAFNPAENSTCVVKTPVLYEDVVPFVSWIKTLKLR